MKLVFFAPGSRGDVQPYLALGHRLLQRGHTVRVVTSLDFADLIEEYGLEAHLVEIDVRRAIQQQAASIEGGGLLASFRAMAELGKRASRELAEKGLKACEGADALIAGFGGLSLATGISERTGVPLIRAYNVPLTPTASSPGALFPNWPSWLPRRLSHFLTRQLLWQASRFASADARRTVLGVGPDPWSPPFEDGGRPVLYGLSDAVLPRPEEWDGVAVNTGFWFADDPPGFEPSPALVDFLASGSAPIYVGFGSMSSEAPAETTRIVLEAIARSGQRAVLHTGWAGLGELSLPTDVHRVESVPHGWLFPRVRAVVHHGGAGTTAAGWRAGVPTVVVPFHGDQPFWASLVAARGLGPAPVPRRKLTAARLADAIVAALAPAIVERAREVGERLRAEDGAGVGADWIEALASGRSRPER